MKRAALWKASAEQPPPGCQRLSSPIKQTVFLLPAAWAEKLDRSSFRAYHLTVAVCMVPPSNDWVSVKGESPRENKYICGFEYQPLQHCHFLPLCDHVGERNKLHSKQRNYTTPSSRGLSKIWLHRKLFCQWLRTSTGGFWEQWLISKILQSWFKVG